MKNIVAVVWLVLMLAAHQGMAQSCCSTSGCSSYNILPNVNNHLIGLRYTRTDYTMRTQSFSPEFDGRKTYDRVNTVDLFGRFQLKKRLQLSVLIPLSYIYEHSDVYQHRTMGLGDMTFLLHYGVLQPKPMLAKPVKHQLRIGLGVKLPSGNFEEDNNNMYSTSVQLGTGSIDFMANVIYTLRYKSFGINAQASYKRNTVNPQQFKFGDKVDGNLQFFYLAELPHVRLMPAVGISYAHAFENVERGMQVYLSYSDLVSSVLSLDIYYKHLAISISGSPVMYNRVAFMGFKQRYSVNGGVYYNF